MFKIALFGAAVAAVLSAPDGCYMNTTTRGVGKPLSTCSSGLQKDGLLCYPECKTGFNGDGPVCWQVCPSTHVDTGAFCQARIEWGNNAACPVEDKCGLFGHSGCVKCPSDFTAHGCVCRSGTTFAKNSYGRGAGTPMGCASGLVPDAGLCYPPCPSGYSSEGPVCWHGCPAKLPYGCGAICMTDSSACVGEVKDLAFTLLELGVDIAECALSSGAKCDPATLAAEVKHVIEDLAMPICTV